MSLFPGYFFFFKLRHLLDFYFKGFRYFTKVATPSVVTRRYGVSSSPVGSRSE